MLVFGLPGNPVSGIVGFLLFVRPTLERLAGRTTVDRSLPTGRLARAFVHSGDRPTYHPARWVAGPGAALETLEWAGSADLRTIARADGFAVFPAGDQVHEAGEIVPFLPLQ
jgi:molybdopterin molybdotransferase